jgi:hypothetical protein
MFRVFIHKYDDIEIEYVLQEKKTFIILWYNLTKMTVGYKCFNVCLKCFMILFPFLYWFIVPSVLTYLHSFEHPLKKSTFAGWKNIYFFGSSLRHLRQMIIRQIFIGFKGWFWINAFSNINSSILYKIKWNSISTYSTSRKSQLQNGNFGRFNGCYDHDSRILIICNTSWFPPLVGLYAAFIMGLVTAIFGGRPGMVSGGAGQQWLF